MEIIISDSYESLSLQAAKDVAALIPFFKDPLLCTASGSSPEGLYKNLVDLIAHGEADISACHFVGLDEWIGMNGDVEGSCRFYLNEQLFNPLKIPTSRICFFDGKATEPEKECAKVEKFINEHNGIDIAILGLGMNGHVGMNEPGTPANSRSHVQAIDPLTEKTAQKYFKEPRQLPGGLTLGIAALLESKHIILIVSGRHKAEIVKGLLEEKVSEQLPATLLLAHEGLKIYLDKEAASLINPAGNA